MYSKGRPFLPGRHRKHEISKLAIIYLECNARFESYTKETMKTTKVPKPKQLHGNQEYMEKLAKALLLFLIIVFLLNACTESVEDGLPGSDSDSSFYHPAGWGDNPQHGKDYSTDKQNCEACHGKDLRGGSSGVSCAGCHHSGWTGTHGEEYASDPDNCKACHGEDLNGEGDQNRDCGHCHHEDAVSGWQHGDYHTLPYTDNCTDCHSADFTGANSLVSCFSCHSGISAFDCTDCHTGAATSYTDSAHGNTSYGVDRSGTGYAQGDCTHCHDLPAGSTNDLLLFAPMNQTSQTENFCFQCHKDTDDSPAQIGMPQQRSYSYRAGGWTADPLDDIKEAFSGTSSHNLGNIVTFITGKWGYTADSNPCAACHNHHAAQRDAHTAGNRGWPVSLPSDHTDSSTWELWGDDSTERMNNYTGNYQAPYRYNSTTTYEPDGSATPDGSNLTDYVTFCTDCHDNSNVIYSTVLGRDLYTIDWNSETHGHGDGDAALSPPYTSGGNYVLACTDCHEPHGSPNIFLTRQKVNKGDDVSVSTGLDNQWSSLCAKCHVSIAASHHTDELYVPMCSECHPSGDESIYQECTYCHYHGSTFTFETYDSYPLF